MQPTPTYTDLKVFRQNITGQGPQSVIVCAAIGSGQCWSSCRWESRGCSRTAAGLYRHYSVAYGKIDAFEVRIGKEACGSSQIATLFLADSPSKFPIPECLGNNSPANINSRIDSTQQCKANSAPESPEDPLGKTTRTATWPFYSF